MSDHHHLGVFQAFGSQRKTDKNPYGFSDDHRKASRAIVAAYEQHGIAWWMRHRPFGELGEDMMDMDMAVTIKNDESWSWVIDAYHEATEYVAGKCPDLKIIDYLGMYESQLDDRIQSGQLSQFMHRCWASVEPLMNHANVWIGFDAASTYENEHVMVPFIEWCKRVKKGNVVVEALPREPNTWAFDHHAFCIQRFWSNIRSSTLNYRRQSDDHLTFRALTGHTPMDVNDFIAECRDDRHIPLVGINRLKEMQ